MAKSSLEKQIEKQMRQAKQLADKQHRDEQKRARDQERIMRKEAIRNQAASIVNGQPLIEGFRIMDATAEAVLQCLLQCEKGQGNQINFHKDILPEYVQSSTELELEKLIQYGMIGGLRSWVTGSMLNILPPAFSYFEEKENAMRHQKKHLEGSQMQSIVNYGNLVFGNVSGSTLSVDNSINEIERAIDEKGGEDKGELHDLLDEVKELIDNMKSSHSIPKQKRLYQKISNHMEKHGWFYGAVVRLLGTATLTMIGE